MPTHLPFKFNTSLTHTLGLGDEGGPRDLYKASSCTTTSPFLNIAPGCGFTLRKAAVLIASPPAASLPRETAHALCSTCRRFTDLAAQLADPQGTVTTKGRLPAKYTSCSYTAKLGGRGAGLGGSAGTRLLHYSTNLLLVLHTALHTLYIPPGFVVFLTLPIRKGISSITITSGF